MHLSMKIKKILFTAFILFTTTISSQQIEWLTLAEAMEAQKKYLKKSSWMFIPIGVDLVSY